MTRDATCAERIGEHQASREEHLRALFTAQENWENRSPDPDYPGETIDSDGAQERLDELPLGVSVSRLLRVELSTGGPADYVTAELDGGDVVRATYHFADWFDHAERSLEPDSPLWRMAEYYAESMPEEAQR